VPTASLLVSKARGLNLIVFAKHCLKAKNSVLLYAPVVKDCHINPCLKNPSNPCNPWLKIRDYSWLIFSPVPRFIHLLPYNYDFQCRFLRICILQLWQIYGEKVEPLFIIPALILSAESGFIFVVPAE